MKKVLFILAVLLTISGVSMAQVHHPVHHRKPVHHRHHRPVHHKPVHHPIHH